MEWPGRIVLVVGMFLCSRIVPAHASDHGMQDVRATGYEAPADEPWAEAPAAEPVVIADRGTLSAIGPVAHARRQPAGALSDIIIYCSPGHGFYADSSAWYVMRPLTNGVVEDMGNLDQVNMFLQYCFNAGATVVPFRPVGCQTNEVVLDNDDAGATFSGTWYDSGATIFYGSSGDVPYRYAYVLTNGESATARYRPVIPAAGLYPVYCWTRRGTDRVRQLYRIRHSGGTNEVRVNHRRVGSGWIWLGTYHFESGTNGWVEISNYAPGAYNPASHVVIADAIRFGNGMGDINRGFGVSGFARELECARYWIQNAVGQGMSSTLYDLAGYDDKDDNIGAPARMAHYMNDATDGGYWDRLYLGFHSNAGGGAGARGAMGLYSTGNNAVKQAQQQAFGLAVNDELDQDMEWGDNGVLFNDDWTDNSSDIYGSVYGEISDGYNSNMNSTIIEVAFHDSADDAKLLRDPAARLAMARACYKGVVKHLNAYNSTNVPLQLLPEPPTHVGARNDGPGRVTVSWQPPATNPSSGHAATGFVVYRSTNGCGFGSPVEVSGGSATAHTFTNLASGIAWYFQVAAVNAGGESLPSETVGVITAPAGTACHLVVNGFTRCDRSLSPTRYFANNINGQVTLVRPLQINAYDYVVPHGDAIAAGQRFFDACSQSAVMSGAVKLTNYHAAYWILGEESTVDETFSSDEQTNVMHFLNGGGCLFVSGAELAWDLYNLGSASDRLFITNHLRAGYSRDSAGTNRATAKAGGIFDGLGSLDFDDGSGDTYRVEYADVLTAQAGATAALVYGHSAGGSDVAAVQFSNTWRVVAMGFPFETITSRDARRAFLARVMDFFGDAQDYDGDADGMPDGWERVNFPGGIEASGEDDEDEDGASNFEEWIAGTLPADAASVFAAEPVAGTDGWVVQWPGAADRLYAVYGGTNVSSLAVLQSGITATPPVNSYTDRVHAAESLMFYRIRAER